MPALTCEVCGKTFLKKEHCARHMRVHTHERPFSCKDCSQSFARRDTLKRHVLSRHNKTSDSRRNRAASPQDAAGDAALNSLLVTPSLTDTTSPVTFHPLEVQLEPGADGSGWQWQTNLELGPEFNIFDFGTDDVTAACPTRPWIPLHAFQDDDAMLDVSASANADFITRPRWFTRHIGPSQWPASAAPAASQEVTTSRAQLATSLQHSRSTLLPPTSFLNRMVKLYTTRLWDMLPIVHLPSFVPAQAHPLLLLSICSLAALAEGTAASLEHATRLYDGVQKAILVSWDPYLILQPASLALLQAATIGQTFAILSSNPAHLATARAFHGTLCVVIENIMDMPASPNTSRNGWIQLQTCIRILNVLQCHDGELAATFQRRPMLRLPHSKMPSPAPDRSFLANAESPRDESRHPLLSCAVLESILAEIIEVRSYRPDVSSSRLQNLETALLDITPNVLSTKLLLCSCFIQLLCDFDMFERSMGRDGAEHDLEQEISAWTRTDTAKRCVLHAVSIAALSSQLRLGDLAALHTARTMFSAAIVLTVFSHHAPHDISILASDLALKYMELRTMDLQTSYDADQLKAFAFQIAGALRSLRPWPNAERFAETLATVCARLEA